MTKKTIDIKPSGKKPGRVFKNLREAHIAALATKPGRTEKEEWVLAELRKRTK